jgi:hypothetical protein
VTVTERTAGGHPAASPAADERRPWTLVAAAVVAVVVVALVLSLGVARPPALPTIADDPAVSAPAEVALLGWDDGETCLTIVATDGSTRRPWCSDQGGELLAWDDRGVVLRRYAGAGDLEVVVDPDTGEIVTSRSLPVDADRPAGPERIEVTTSRTVASGSLEVRSGDGTVLWRTDAPRSYDVTGGWSHPDGEVVALLDSARRLLLVPADGSSEPRVWAEDVTTWVEVVLRAAG